MEIPIRSPKLHSYRNDYGNSLEVINRAYRKQIKPKIFSKVFYNYPNFRSKRYRSILTNCETLKRLNVVPENLISTSLCNQMIYEQETVYSRD